MYMSHIWDLQEDGHTGILHYYVELENVLATIKVPNITISPQQ